MYGATKSEYSQTFSAFFKFMKRLQTKFHADAMSKSKVTRWKWVKIFR